MGLMINFMTFPVIYLIMFLFKYSKPRKLRKNRILEALLSNKETPNLNDKNDDDMDQLNLPDTSEVCNFIFVKFSVDNFIFRNIFLQLHYI